MSVRDLRSWPTYPLLDSRHLVLHPHDWNNCCQVKNPTCWKTIAICYRSLHPPIWMQWMDRSLRHSSSRPLNYGRGVDHHREPIITMDVTFCWILIGCLEQPMNRTKLRSLCEVHWRYSHIDPHHQTRSIRIRYRSPRLRFVYAMLVIIRLQCN